MRSYYIFHLTSWYLQYMYLCHMTYVIYYFRLRLFIGQCSCMDSANLQGCHLRRSAKALAQFDHIGPSFVALLKKDDEHLLLLIGQLAISVCQKMRTNRPTVSKNIPDPCIFSICIHLTPVY